MQLRVGAARGDVIDSGDRRMGRLTGVGGFSARTRSDPFDTTRQGFVTSDGTISQTSQCRFGARGLVATYNHALGQQPRVPQRGPEQSDPGEPGEGPPR